MEVLKVKRKNPLVKMPLKWLNEIQPDKEPIVKLIREIDGNRIIITAAPPTNK